MATLQEQLTEAQTSYAAAVQAERDALQAQELRLTSAGGIDRAEVMPDLNAIRRSISYWRGRISTLQAMVDNRPTFAGMTYSSANFGD
ncbi:MAG: hypothetical protein AB7P37_03290 [Ramlibacter sp.]